jgi:hypothetical protein
MVGGGMEKLGACINDVMATSEHCVHVFCAVMLSCMCMCQ